MGVEPSRVPAQRYQKYKNASGSAIRALEISSSRSMMPANVAAGSDVCLVVHMPPQKRSADRMGTTERKLPWGTLVILTPEASSLPA